MKTLILLAATIGFLVVAPSLTQANETMEIYADSTLAGNNGSLLRIMEPGFPTQTVFVFEELGKIRIFALREAGIPGWDILPSSQYFTQTTSMAIGNTWRFLDDDSGNETVAIVASQENVATPAGSFSTFKVDIALASAPGTVVESLWFSSGTGLVQDQGYVAGVVDWTSWLTNFTIVGGSGYFPLAIGNIWINEDVSVAVDNISWGKLKSWFLPVASGPR